MFGRRRKRQVATPEQAKVRHPLLRLLTADIVLRGVSLAVSRAMQRGQPPGQPPGMASKVATTIATRSVPGAVLVGSGLVVRALYRRGLARRAARTGEQNGPRT